MSIILYFIIAFIIFFFTFKSKEEIMKEKVKKGKLRDSWIMQDITDTAEFWHCILISTIWIITIPFYILWKVLDFIYNKFNKK